MGISRGLFPHLHLFSASLVSQDKITQLDSPKGQDGGHSMMAFQKETGKWMLA
jgi:hypothetical protein